MKKKKLKWLSKGKKDLTTKQRRIAIICEYFIMNREHQKKKRAIPRKNN